MRRTLLAGPGLLLLWQIAPVHATPDSTGRIRISLGYGAGTYQSRADVVNCSGQTVQSSEKSGSWSAQSADVEAWVSSRVRAAVTAARHTATPDVPERWLATSQVAYEGPVFGAGGGVAYLGGIGSVTTPVLYARVGGLEHRHVRIEVLLPDPPGGDRHPWYRAAVGFNQGRHPGTRWLVGVASRGLSGESGLLWTGTVGLPIRRDLEFLLEGRMGMGTLYHADIAAEGRYTSWRLAAGMRVSLGR